MHYQHIAVIGIDGMGNFCTKTDTPRLDEIFAEGAVTNYAISMDPTISAENWGAMLLGTDPLVHTLTNDIVSSQPYTNEAIPSVFHRIRQADPEAYLASVCNWNPINGGIIEDDVGVDKRTAHTDEELLPEVLDCVKRKPKFLFVQFDDVDGAGHGYGYGSEQHLASIRIADALTGQIYDAYRSAGILEKTLFIVLADHGGYRNGHGGYTDTEKYIFFGVSGKGVCKGKIPYAQTKDLAALVLYGLDMEVPAYQENGFSSQIPAGVFPGENHYIRKEVPRPVIRETPGNLTTYFPAEQLNFVLHLDHTLEDLVRKCNGREQGSVKFYSNGVNSGCVELGYTGSVCIDQPQAETAAYTLAFWVQRDPNAQDTPVILSAGCNKGGFCLRFDRDCLEFIIRCCGQESTVRLPIPERDRKWIHYAVSVDAAGRQIKFYTNFRHQGTLLLEDAFLPVLSADRLIVGDDPKQSYNRSHQFLFRLDDLIEFRGAFSQREVTHLEHYYGQNA